MKKTILLSISILALGCSGGLDEEESSQAFAATQLVLTQGAASAGASSNGPADTLNINHAFNCLEGGNATFAGNIETSDENTSFKYSVDFDSCVSQGVTMNGTMDYDLSFEKTGEQSFKSVYSFSGNLDYSGKVDGSCEMELVATSSVSQSGGTFSYVGNLCGNDAQSSLNTSIDFDDLGVSIF